MESPHHVLKDVEKEDVLDVNSWCSLVSIFWFHANFFMNEELIKNK